jgi:hypothetical protein
MNQQVKVEFTQSASAIGAFVLGIGVGLLFFTILLPAKLLFLITGVILHGWGMIKLATFKNGDGSPLFYSNHWIRLSLWICVLAIMSLIVYLFY